MLLPIPKKGDAFLRSNYRTIALHSIAGKAYANVLSACLSQWLSENLLDEQCGFRPSRTTVDALFSLQVPSNGAWDKGQTLHICMLDLTKAFDSVDGEMAWQILLSRVHPQSLSLSSGTSTRITQQSSAARLTLSQLAPVLNSGRNVCLLHPCSMSILTQWFASYYHSCSGLASPFATR